MKVFSALSIALVPLVAVQLPTATGKGLFVEINRELLTRVNQAVGGVPGDNTPGTDGAGGILRGISSRSESNAGGKNELLANPDDGDNGALLPGIMNRTETKSSGTGALPAAASLPASIRELIANDPPASGAACAHTNAVPESPSVDVLILVSSCFDLSIWSWIEPLEREINFVTRMFDDLCWLNPAKPWLEASRPKPVAVISIIFDTIGFNQINGIMNSRGYDHFIGFNYIWFGAYNFPGYNRVTYIPSRGRFDLDTYNLFTIARELHCHALEGSVPTSYIDASGNHQCFCSCPIGFHKTGYRCPQFKTRQAFVRGTKSRPVSRLKSRSAKKPSTKMPSGSARSRTWRRVCCRCPQSSTTTSTTTATMTATATPSCSLRSRTLSSNKRRSRVTRGVGGPFNVEQGDKNGITTSFKWKSYQGGAATKINNVEFTYVGRYDLELKARDYCASDTTCAGCLLVVDSRRPTANPSFTCPSSVNSVTTPLTDANLASAQAAVNGVSAFKTNALNDPCSPNVRCDNDQLLLKTFGQTAYSLTQCVSVNGHTVASATATLQSSIKTTSQTVVSKLNNDQATSADALAIKYKRDSTVHAALECTQFQTSASVLLGDDDAVLITPEVCTYTSTIANLLNVGAVSASSGAIFTDAEVNGFVAWRYKVDGGDWKPFSAPAEVFYKTQTAIVVQAWTQCGIVNTFTFSVELHLDNPIAV